MKTHKLKSWPEQFAALRSGEKTFEYRKNDRNFQVGDALVLYEWDPNRDPGHALLQDGRYTGRLEVRVVVHALLSGFGLPEEYCVLGVAPVRKET